jgi:replicative DNA helicase|tara:strand:+ start:798 stop:2129 length:1332 start_codon:yes stop_codon:yes gene_type:complete
MNNFESNNYTLPNNILAEKIILATVLKDSESINFILENLSVDSFFDEVHKVLFQAILDLNVENKAINFTSLINSLQDKGLLNKVGGINIVMDLVREVVIVGNLSDYISLVQEKFLRRNLISLGYQLIKLGYVIDNSLEDVFEVIEKGILDLNQKKVSTTLVSSKVFLEDTLTELKSISQNSNLPGLATTFHDLDAMTQGFQKSDLIIIAGRPSMGKTALCLNLLQNIAQDYDLPMVLFSLEMSRQQLVYRLLASDTEISNTRLRSGRLNTIEWSKLHDSIERLSKLPVFIDDIPNITIFEIRTKIRKLKLEHGDIGVIIIDYLQLMHSSNKSENRVQELSELTRSLKITAREFNVPIIVLSQLSRAVETRTNKRPLLSDLRESGSIEQDADLVLMLYRDDYYNSDLPEKNVTELIVAKHRNGPTGTVKLKFNPVLTKFSNYSY